MIDASIQNTVMQGNLQQNQDSYELACLLSNRSGLEHVIFFTSSVCHPLANENALKIVFQKKQPATRILAFEGCFMERTLHQAQITDKAASRRTPLQSEH